MIYARQKSLIVHALVKYGYKKELISHQIIMNPVKKTFSEYKRCILSQAKDAAPCFQMYNDVCRSDKINVKNPLTAGAAYIRVFIFYEHIKYHLLIC